MKIMVNNCLSHEVDRLFKGAILERKVLYKNKVLYNKLKLDKLELINEKTWHKGERNERND